MEDTLIQLQSWVNRLYACIMEVASLLETAAVNCHAACEGFLFQQNDLICILEFSAKKR